MEILIVACIVVVSSIVGHGIAEVLYRVLPKEW